MSSVVYLARAGDSFNEAVRYLVDIPPEKRFVASTSILRERFGLNTKEAVAAIREANRVRWGIQPYDEGGRR